MLRMISITGRLGCSRPQVRAAARFLDEWDRSAYLELAVIEMAGSMIAEAEINVVVVVCAMVEMTKVQIRRYGWQVDNIFLNVIRKRRGAEIRGYVSLCSISGLDRSISPKYRLTSL